MTGSVRSPRLQLFILAANLTIKSRALLSVQPEIPTRIDQKDFSVMGMDITQPQLVQIGGGEIAVLAMTRQTARRHGCGGQRRIARARPRRQFGSSQRRDSSTLPVTGIAQDVSLAGTPAIQTDSTPPFSRQSDKSRDAVPVAKIEAVEAEMAVLRSAWT